MNLDWYPGQRCKCVEVLTLPNHVPNWGADEIPRPSDSKCFVPIEPRGMAVLRRLESPTPAPALVE